MSRRIIKVTEGHSAARKRLYLVRHAQSASNVGLPTDNFKEIPLTEYGRKQAEELAAAVGVSDETGRVIYPEPELIVSSPFTRTIDTAAPLLRRFPMVHTEIWNSAGEFTYLSPIRCAGTSGVERKAWRDAYYERNDADYNDGDGAESFNDFKRRVDSVLQKLWERPETCIYFFSHGMFLQGLLCALNHSDVWESLAPAEFRKLPQLKNCEVIEVKLV